MNPDISDKRVRDLRMQIAAAPRTRDPALHLELAEVLYRRSEFGEAMNFLTPVLTDPLHRVAAMQLVADIITARGRNDLGNLLRNRAAEENEAPGLEPPRR